MHTAARYGHAGVTRILISAQSRVAEQNKNGDTALHIAAAMGRRKLTRILLEAGCDKSLRNQQNETARDIAQRKELDEIIHILNTPIAKQSKKKKHRDKSKERTLDETDAPKKPKDKNKKKKNVHFETTPIVDWSPYGCHYYPDPKYFPKPKLSSLPTEPLKKGEQYYLDLAGNIKKGPIGAGYTCYCAPFFKHMENKINEDKRDLKKHIDRAHNKLDQKVIDLEMKTQGQISELTRFMAAERAFCKERHQHLEQWLTRGMLYRASERVKKLDFSPKGSLDIPPIKRTRSLEVLDCNMEDWNRVHKIIKNFNQNSERFETKDLEDFSKLTSKSTEILDNGERCQSPLRRNILQNSKSSDQLNSCRRRNLSPPYPSTSSHASPLPEPNKNLHVTAEIHVKSNKLAVSQSPVSVEMEYHDRYRSPSLRSNTKSPSSSNRQGSESRGSDYGSDRLRTSQNMVRSSPDIPVWKSQVLQRTADDMRKRVLFEKELVETVRSSSKSGLDISQDGYVKIPKQNTYQEISNHLTGGNKQREARRSVQEMVAQVEHKQRMSRSPEPTPLLRNDFTPTEQCSQIPDTIAIQQSPNEALEQPLRPAPILKEKPPKSKRFSIQNLIPFPTRKTFQAPPKDTGNNSESSDEEDNPIRTINQPGPMKNANLLQTLPMPNYERMSNKSQSPAPQSQIAEPMKAYSPIDLRSMVPKDAYFHEIPNRPVHHTIPFRDRVDCGLPIPQYSPTSEFEAHNEPGLPTQTEPPGRNRNPLYHQNGIFDAMMQDHIMREMERIPQCYSEHLDQNTEIEIAKQDYYDKHQIGPLPPNFRGNCGARRPLQADHNLLHSRLQSLAINTHLTDTQSQLDRESHNDSGYSTKVYGSSQGPSPSLSGHVDGDNLSGQRIHMMPNGKQIGASSLV